MRHRDKIILEKIIAEVDVVTGFLDGVSLDEFLESELLKRAVSMTVINIGELVKNVSDELLQEHLEIPWRQIAGFRDITAHRYQTLRMEDVYRTVEDDFPVLRKQMSAILEL